MIYKSALAIFGFVFYYIGRARVIAVKTFLERKYSKMGVNIILNGPGVVLGLKELVVGRNVHLGDGYHIDARGGVKIGDNVHISRNLVLYSTSHQFDGKRVPYDETLREKSIVIEDNVWIGMNVVVLPGSKLREGSIVGAGSVVSGEVDAKAIFVAPKSFFLKYRDAEKYDQNVAAKRFGAANGIAIRRSEA